MRKMTCFRGAIFFFCSGMALAMAQGQSPTVTKDHFEIADFGAKADGKTDDTAVIQKALHAAGKHGGVVTIPTGKYLVAGSLKIPKGVALLSSLPNMPSPPVAVAAWRSGTAFPNASL